MASNDADADPDVLRAKYRAERDRRIRPDGTAQYRRAAGEFGYYAADPYTARGPRDPVRNRVEVLIVGAGFGGLLTGARLRQAGFSGVVGTGATGIQVIPTWLATPGSCTSSSAPRPRSMSATTGRPTPAGPPRWSPAGSGSGWRTS